MSILYTLHKLLDTRERVKSEADERSAREDQPLDPAEGNLRVPPVEVPPRAPTRYRCGFCGFEDTEKSYCPECLTFMDRANK